ncbi:MAG TPA: hypothetical protein VK470_01215, partial [Bacteroidota bacterium]|nr:hypothetical protein [Bacteroidota bacterium]
SAQWQPLQFLEFSGNATYSRNRFVDHTEFASDGSPISLNGKRIAGFPDLLANARVTLRLDQASVSFAMRHVGKFYTTNREEESRTVDAFTVGDLAVSWTLTNILSLQSLELKCDVSNVFDVLYAPNGEKDEFFPASTRSVFVSLGVEL